MKKVLRYLVVAMVGMIGAAIWTVILYCNDPKGYSEIKKHKGEVIVKVFCTGDDFTYNYIVVRNLKTRTVTPIDVDYRSCSLYQVGDTLK